MGNMKKWEHTLGNVFNDRVRVLSGCQDGLLGCVSFPCIGGVFLKTPSWYNTQIWAKPFVLRC